MSHLVVVGGGIAGLCEAFRYLKGTTDASRSRSVTVLEASPERLGGRIRTVVRDGHAMDAGAGRFSGPAQHPKLWALLRELGLEGEVVGMRGGIQYVRDGVPVDAARMAAVHAALRAAARKEPQSERGGLSMEMWARTRVDRVTDSDVDDLVAESGYQSPFDRLDAVEATAPTRSFLYSSSWKYYSLRGGMVRLVEALEDRLRRDRRCRILLGAEVRSVARSRSQVSPRSSRQVGGFRVAFSSSTSASGRALQADEVALCLPGRALLACAGDLIRDEAPRLHDAVLSGRSSPLDRIYARFDRAWWTPLLREGVHKVTSNGAVRQFIPIDDAAGLAMACYTEGRFAEQWGDLLHDPALLRKTLMEGLGRVFPGVEIPEPLWVEHHHWPQGVHYDSLAAPMPGKRVRQGRGWRLLGEAVSRWIEGALE